MSANGLFLGRVERQLLKRAIVDSMDRWITENTTLNDRPFSFLHHEALQHIARDPGQHIIVRKCSQVGMSELMVRLVLALLYNNRNLTAILTLPTAQFASNFAKSRIDPVIDDSPPLRGAMRKAADSSTFKQIGTSQLHIRGTIGKSAGISTPAQMLVSDEVDFSDLKQLSKFASRLRHAEGGGRKFEFSTPTVQNYGITKLFNLSTQLYYMCKCTHCGQRQAPDFLKSVVIPGFERKIEEFEAADLTDPGVSVDSAYLACEKCGGSLEDALRDPQSREFVAKYPSRDIRGYQINPFDVPKYNPTVSILRQVAEYVDRSDWFNFVLGVPYSPSNSKFDVEAVKQNSTLPFWGLLDNYTGTTVMGADSGKNSRWIVGRKSSGGRYEVVAFGIVRHVDGPVHEQLTNIARHYNVALLIVDAMPDFTTAKEVVKTMPGRAFAAYYGGTAKRTLEVMQINDDDKRDNYGTVNIHRTKAFDYVVELVNKGRVLWPRSAGMEKLCVELEQIARVKKQTESGDTIYVWEKLSSNDHFAHALVYMMMAADGLEAGYRGRIQLPTGLTIAHGAREGAESEALKLKERQLLINMNGPGIGNHGQLR